MVELYIKINNKYLKCDLDDDFQIVLNLEMKNYIEFSNNSAFSKTIVLPGTDRNREIFSYIEQMGSVDGSVLLNKKFSAIIVYNNYYYFGKIIIQKVVSNYNFHINQIEALFVADINKLVSALTNKKLKDITDLLPTYQYSNPAYFDQDIDYIMQTEGPYPDIMFGAVDVGVNIAGDDHWAYINLAETPVFVRVKAIIDKIFDVAGVRYTSDSFFNVNNEFKAIYTFENIKKSKIVKSAYVGSTNAYLLPGNGNSNYSNYADYFFAGNLILNNQNNIPYHDNYNLVNDTTYTVTANGNTNAPIQIIGKFKIKIIIDFTDLRYSSLGPSYSPPANYSDPAEFTMSVSSSSATQAFIVGYTLTSYDPYTGNGVYKGYILPNFNIYYYNALNHNIVGNCVVHITDNYLYDNLVQINKIDVVIEKNDINIFETNYQTPQKLQFSDDIMALDFLMDIFKMFNLAYIETNKDEYYIDTLDNFISKYNTLDITPYVDLSQNIEHIGGRLVNSNKYIYKFKDANDYYNEYYRKNVGRTYGDRVIVLGNELNLSESKIELKTIAPAPYTIFSNAYITVVKNYDANKNKWVKAQNQPLRLVYFSMVYDGIEDVYVGFRSIEEIISEPINVNGVYQINKLPIFTHHANNVNAPPYYNVSQGYQNDPVAYPQYNLNFDNPLYMFLYQLYFTNKNLFTQYYYYNFHYVTDADSRIIRLKMAIPGDINVKELFQRKLFFRDNYYFLNLIKNFIPGKDSLCDLELIKIKPINPFNYSIEFNFEDTNPTE